MGDLGPESLLPHLSKPSNGEAIDMLRANLEAPICKWCGAQYSPSNKPPANCKICLDERQGLPKNGQQWTTQQRMLDKGYRNCFHKYEPGLYGIGTIPKIGIGQRALLLQTPQGNILWDSLSFLDEATIDIINALGGVKAIAISHPHYYSSNAQLSAAFGNVPVYIHEWDRKWITWEHQNLRYWSGETLQLWEGMTLIHLGGHFAGSMVLHWADGADGKGVFLTGDSLQVGLDRQTISIMRAFHNWIPLSASHVERISKRLEPWQYERLYGEFWEQEIAEDAKAKVDYSLKRYIKWLHNDDAQA